MEQIFISIIIGILVGVFDIFNYKIKKILNKFSTAALLVMLWCLGAKIGCNEELLANLGLLGFKATFIAIGVIIGSLFFLWLLTRFLAVELPRIEEDN